MKQSDWSKGMQSAKACQTVIISLASSSAYSKSILGIVSLLLGDTRVLAAKISGVAQSLSLLTGILPLCKP